MNLNCNCNCNYNCINNVYMEPMLSIYVKVENEVRDCPIYFMFKYLYNGKWIEKRSEIISLGESTRIYYERSSAYRNLTIFKITSSKDIFIFHTMVSSDDSACYKVTGSNVHSFINKVSC